MKKTKLLLLSLVTIMSFACSNYDAVNNESIASKDDALNADIELNFPSKYHGLLDIEFSEHKNGKFPYIGKPYTGNFKTKGLMGEITGEYKNGIPVGKWTYCDSIYQINDDGTFERTLYYIDGVISKIVKGEYKFNQDSVSRERLEYLYFDRLGNKIDDSSYLSYSALGDGLKDGYNYIVEYNVIDNGQLDAWLYIYKENENDSATTVNAEGKANLKVKFNSLDKFENISSKKYKGDCSLEIIRDADDGLLYLSVLSHKCNVKKAININHSSILNSFDRKFTKEQEAEFTKDSITYCGNDYCAGATIHQPFRVLSDDSKLDNNAYMGVLKTFYKMGAKNKNDMKLILYVFQLGLNNYEFASKSAYEVKIENKSIISFKPLMKDGDFKLEKTPYPLSLTIKYKDVNTSGGFNLDQVL